MLMRNTIVQDRWRTHRKSNKSYRYCTKIVNVRDKNRIPSFGNPFTKPSELDPSFLIFELYSRNSAYGAFLFFFRTARIGSQSIGNRVGFSHVATFNPLVWNSLFCFTLLTLACRSSQWFLALLQWLLETGAVGCGKKCCPVLFLKLKYAFSRRRLPTYLIPPKQRAPKGPIKKL